MSHKKYDIECPHCGEPLKAFEMPIEMAYEHAIQWACFNNDCPYFKEGWDWMWENYSAKVSYSYRVVNPDTGETSPLTVWSETAIVDRILKDDE